MVQEHPTTEDTSWDLRPAVQLYTNVHSVSSMGHQALAGVPRPLTHHYYYVKEKLCGALD